VAGRLAALLTELDRLNLRDKVVVNQVGWADRTIAGQALEQPAAATRNGQNGMLAGCTTISS
jgi:hypothetical protein